MSRTPRIDRIDRNLLINGNFDFWQRGVSSTTQGYLADRWLATSSTTSYTQEVGGPDSRSSFYARLAGGSGSVVLIQRVESNFSRQITNDKITLSLKMRQLTGTLQDAEVRIRVPVAVDNYATQTEVGIFALKTLTSDWQDLSVTLDVTASMKANGFSVEIGKIGASTPAVEFDYAQIVMVEGESVSNYTLAGRDFADELKLCQRYFEKSWDVNAPVGTTGFNGSREAHVSFNVGNGNALFTQQFLVRKRSVPVVEVYNPDTGNPNTIRRFGGSNFTGISKASLSESSFRITNASGSTMSQNGYSWHYTADAEL